MTECDCVGHLINGIIYGIMGTVFIAATIAIITDLLKGQ
jgi:hypothetical protein